MKDADKKISFNNFISLAFSEERNKIPRQILEHYERIEAERFKAQEKSINEAVNMELNAISAREIMQAKNKELGISHFSNPMNCDLNTTDHISSGFLSDTMPAPSYRIRDRQPDQYRIRFFCDELSFFIENGDNLILDNPSYKPTPKLTKRFDKSFSTEAMLFNHYPVSLKTFFNPTEYDDIMLAHRFLLETKLKAYGFSVDTPDMKMRLKFKCLDCEVGIMVSLNVLRSSEEEHGAWAMIANNIRRDADRFFHQPVINKLTEDGYAQPLVYPLYISSEDVSEFYSILFKRVNIIQAQSSGKVSTGIVFSPQMSRIFTLACRRDLMLEVETDPAGGRYSAFGGYPVKTLSNLKQENVLYILSITETIQFVLSKSYIPQFIQDIITQG